MIIDVKMIINDYKNDYSRPYVKIYYHFFNFVALTGCDVGSAY